MVAQARETQGHIAEAALELFIERGYVGTSIRDIAERAGVSVQTIYNAFDGGKAAIFGRVMDIVVVGDDEPLTMAERPEFRAMLETTDPGELLSIGVSLNVALLRRMEPLLPTIRAAISSDPAIADSWRTNYGQNRYEGMAEGMARLADLGALRNELDAARATDILWALLRAETCEALVVERRWTPAEYTAWILETLASSLLRKPAKR